MFEVQGKYASAKIFAEIAEESAIAQILTLCNQPVSEGAKIRIMPDVHTEPGQFRCADLSFEKIFYPVSQFYPAGCI